MILVMGGTSEARDLIENLDNSQVVYTTITANTTHLSRFNKLPKIHLVGPLDSIQLVNIIKNYEIKYLIDATHPFAVNASSNAIDACNECRIPYFRLERPRVEIPASDLIRIVSDFNGAVRVIQELEGVQRILLSIGVKHLEYFLELFEDESREVYCQVLDVPESLEMARSYGIPLDRILTANGVPTVENIYRILQEFQLDLMVFKESGYQGGTDAKIEAGMMTNTRMISIDRPLINYPKVFESVEDLVSFLRDM
jgi:precorrin-6A/cobalt-precorrin-6A reductase